MLLKIPASPRIKVEQVPIKAIVSVVIFLSFDCLIYQRYTKFAYLQTKKQIFIKINFLLNRPQVSTYHS